MRPLSFFDRQRGKTNISGILQEMMLYYPCMGSDKTMTHAPVQVIYLSFVRGTFLRFAI